MSIPTTNQNTAMALIPNFNYELYAELTAIVEAGPIPPLLEEELTWSFKRDVLKPLLNGKLP